MEAFTHRRIRDLLFSARRPVLVADERIDGDSLGSALAFADLLLSRGVRAPVVVSEPVPAKYRFLPNVESCTTDVSALHDPDVDLVVVFDCSDGGYIERLFASRLPAFPPFRPPIINIDHHVTNPGYGTVNQVVVSACATAEVVYRFFRENRIEIGRDAATCLVAGICFDTTVFSNSATSARAFESAAELVASGARIHEVIRHLYRARSLGMLRAWGAALSRLREHPARRVIATYLTRADVEESGAAHDELEGLANFLGLVVDADVLFVLRETATGEVKASMRSSGPDVSRVARAMGGGGHARAAGFTVPVGAFACDDAGCWNLVERALAVLE